ncbi:MAG: hypothetical protein JOZ24_12630, partial [Candidatus Eremiobacteraeota bacterium]|nr:hypothetical protein [Candidatus Eremiobacteraeota bacterium]
MTIRRFLCVLALCALGAGTLFVVTRATTAAQPVTPIGHRAPFAHVIIVVQENRTPDNLFYALCTHRPLSVEPRCSASPGPAQYEIQPAGWHDKTAPDKAVDPKPIPLANWYDLGHSHGSFTTACDASTGSTDCRMDGSAGVSCRPAKGHPCPDRPQFRYVDNSTGTIEPYIQMALQYGWANRMFQANQGPSYPAHQFLFGGTSAPTGPDDGRGVFVSENLVGTGAVGGFNKPAGCASPARTRTTVLHPDGSTTRIYPCFRHRALPDVFPANVSWRYYVPSNGSIWTAPNSLAHMCRPNGHHAGSKCVGPIYTQHVVIPPTQVRTDIAKCALQSVSWVIPAGPYSDHAGPRAGDG